MAFVSTSLGGGMRLDAAALQSSRLYARAPASAARRVAPAGRRGAATAAAAAIDDPAVATKLELLKKVACLNRGAIGTSNDKYEVSSFVEVLEEIASASGSPVDLDRAQGKWELLYSSVEQFRSSPFFWAFQEGLVQNRDIASEIFKFTDAIPGAQVGAAFQTLSFDTGKLISEVDLVVFPGVRGTVVTTSDIAKDDAAGPGRLAVTVLNTRVANSNLLPFIDTVTVPVKDIAEAVRGAGATRVSVEVTYLDDDMRIARTRPDGQIFVYRRV